MKTAFIYTAIGILVVVVLIQIYFMREGFFTSSADKLAALNKAITLCTVTGNTSDCVIAAGNGGNLSDRSNVPGVAMSLDSSDKHKCNSADTTMNDNTYLTNVLRNRPSNATILSALNCIKAGFTPATTTSDASGNNVTVDASGNNVTVDSSGNLVTLSLSDLFYALRFGGSSTNTPAPPPSVPTPLSVSTASSLSEEDKNSLSKDIAKSVKDQILSERSLELVLPASADSCATNSACVSDSCSQGAEYMSGAPFNANDYIRKDSIPCYGCTLPQ
jgi:hypothetical protein